jgi:hypothetical protein
MRVTVLTKVAAYLREAGRELELPEVAGRFPHIPRKTLAGALSNGKARGLFLHAPLYCRSGWGGRWRGKWRHRDA